MAEKITAKKRSKAVGGKSSASSTVSQDGDAAKAAKADWRLPDSVVGQIVDGHYRDPFAVLGTHQIGKSFCARCLIPGAEKVVAHDLAGKACGALEERHDGGFFEGKVTLKSRQPLKYHCENADGAWWATDPYGFGPVLGPMDDYYVSEGSHLRLFDRLGAHVMEHEGAQGVHFAVWAPNATRVSVVGDFNFWDGRRNPMRLRLETGIWEIFLPDLEAGTVYKFEIVGRDGQVLPLKSDPFANKTELRPQTASIVAKPSTHVWNDAKHRAHWADLDARRVPISIYEVHPGSWRKNGNKPINGEDAGFLSWDEMADYLIPYCVEMGFTHIEFLPISEYPYDPSWGYQTTGLFAPTARFGEPEALERFIDGAHQVGLGVLIDWVPAHFPVDAHGLAKFDGTALYEHEDPKQGFHPDWNTAIYNFGRKEVVSFLVNNALYWAEKYHIDGLRVDAVASMLYLDYSREEGEWIPNQFGGRENLEAVEFLKQMNMAFYGTHKGVFTVAEESTSWPGVSKPVHDGGLGFGFKWNMGFMHDTLQYIQRDAIHRKHHHNDLTFGLLYAFSENFVLPISHDEVVHGKGSMLTKMPGDDWQKFANLRAYYGLMWGYPGKKLLFMGQEFAQREEWDEKKSLDWHLLDAPAHKGVQNFVRDLNHAYSAFPALHARDCEGDGFEWLVVDDAENSVISWLRKSPDAPPVAVICNLTPVPRDHYRLPLPHAGTWTEIINSDATLYGGTGMGNMGKIDAQNSDGAIAAHVVLPPLSTLMFRYDGAAPTKGSQS